MPAESSSSISIKPKKGRGRPAPSPRSILDRQALLQALDERDIVVKQEHITGFYQSLHRHHYPPLTNFVEQYYHNEKLAAGNNVSKKENATITEQPQLPLKNAITTRKNRNRINLPKLFLQFLADPANGFVTVTSQVAKVMTSGDGSTTKLAVQLHDGQLVESVLMRYGARQENKILKSGRASLCVSSQVGCAMACNFCATGMMGLTGSLHYSEILEQVIHAERILAKEALERRTLQQENNNNNNNEQSKKQSKKDKTNTDLDVVRNIVFMGMGEPLDNYSNVVEACRALIDRKRWNLAHGRVTVSTVGIASKIRKLTQDLPEVSLALSLHAPNQRLRSVIVPTAKHYPIQDIIDALDGHMKAAIQPRQSDANTHHRPPNGSSSSRRRAMIEYVMLEGETSSFECAHELGKLCQDRNLVVNLIPYNQTDVKDKLRCPSREHIREFQRIVTSYGTFCTTRRTMGADIDSACGQLVVLENNNNKEKAVVLDIEDGIGPIASTKTSSVSNNNNSKSVAVVKKSSSRETPASINPPASNDNNGATATDLEKWILPLQIATAISASCFLLSTALYLKQRRQ
ncbi:RNA methyltransferase RlmN [Seminavis robusta]|uniref:RNA methyltransferase RlmN n=1 Tax=Seminavis robusta TaxID=568900 RepID=A0A9N8DU99_9STRA|nr:RNA methyltransferase RlmN [Seminavis robusta]|eukprot:Sro355_g125110.1 RNA methyltransferase RlmN (576) ;mRNA; f:39473-41324